jgi:hypothetical protein
VDDDDNDVDCVTVRLAEVEVNDVTVTLAVPVSDTLFVDDSLTLPLLVGVPV